MDLQPTDGKKSNQIIKLTNRGRLFIEYMADGLKTHEAYIKAGYKGNAHAAYELKRLLATHLRERLEARGFSLEGVAQELMSLSSHPVTEKIYDEKTKTYIEKPLSSLSLNQKLSILKLFLQALQTKNAGPSVSVKQVTAFVVNRHPSANDDAARGPVIDTTSDDKLI